MTATMLFQLIFTERFTIEMEAVQEILNKIHNEGSDVEMNEKIKDLKQKEDEKPQNNIFDTEEIQIEELAIDGICGVY